MSYTNIETHKEHMLYEALDIDTRIAIDVAFQAARKALEANGVKELANDDRAEELIAAIAYYVRRSSRF